MLVDKVSSSDKSEDLISKAEFESLYPTGYRHCEFFSKPSHWAMNTGKQLRKNIFILFKY